MKDLTLAILLAVRSLLRAPARWTKHELALDGAGDACPPESPRACEWCLAGALQRATHDLLGDAPPWEAVEAAGIARGKVADAICARTGQDARANRHLERKVIIEFNDPLGRKHADVLAVLDDAIKARKARNGS